VSASPHPSALRVRGLVKRYGAAKSCRAAVDGLDLDVAAGSVVALLGPNGAGKSTTVEVCTGFACADGGEVRVLGTDPRGAPDALRARVGVMPQGGGAYPGVRAGEMLRLVAACAADPLDVGWLLGVLGLDACATTPYKRLSGGQQQRLALACALVGRPELVFLDEPTAGMDPQARRTTWALLEELRTDGVTVVLTTHYLEEAERLADRVHIIDHGALIASGSPLELTRGGKVSTIRLVVTKPFPPGAPDSLRQRLGERTEVRQLDELSLLVTGPADSSTLAKVSAWCEEHDVLPETLSLGQRTLEDVFLQLTGRELTP
jgi:ABC-2 type transport system ATP-binding protein